MGAVADNDPPANCPHDRDVVPQRICWPFGRVVLDSSQDPEYHNSTDVALSTRKEPMQFPYRITSTDPELFLIRARTKRYDITWRIRIRWSSGVDAGVPDAIFAQVYPFRLVEVHAQHPSIVLALSRISVGTLSVATEPAIHLRDLPGVLVRSARSQAS